jgi:hypothetical protein
MGGVMIHLDDLRSPFVCNHDINTAPAKIYRLFIGYRFAFVNQLSLHIENAEHFVWYKAFYV